MRILHGPRHSATVVFGEGLLGSAVIRRYRAAGSRSIVRMPMPWGNPEAFGTVWKSARRYLGGVHRLNVLWAAGRAGFGSGSEETEKEWCDYRVILDEVCEWAANAETRFLLVSSAGGLFEGQRNVGPEAEAHPRRPYGELKLRQEKELLRRATRIEGRIYRPSTIYGYAAGLQRIGVVHAMIRNGLTHRVTSVVGDPDTLRDYVWVEDIARYVVDDLDRSTSGRPVMLVVGRPVSITQIKAEVERVLHRQLYVSYAMGGDNRAPMSFLPRCRPADWCPCGIGEGISHVFRQHLAEPYAVRT